MPVTATPTSQIVVTRDQVRLFMRDRAENNILLDAVQFSDNELNTATEFAVHAFNAVTPQSTWTPSNFPNPYVLLIGTVRFLLQSEAFQQIRNQSSYQDGEIAPIGLSDKMAAYAQLAQELKAEFNELTRGMKSEANCYAGFASLSSGYRNVGRSRM